MTHFERVSTILLAVGVGCAMVASTGCVAVGDVLIPHHPASYAKSGYATSVFLTEKPPVLVSPKEQRPASCFRRLCMKLANRTTYGLLPSVAVAAASVLVDQTVKVADSESKKYAASYSARTSGYFVSKNGETAKGILIQRTCGTNAVFSLAIDVETDVTNGVFRLKPKQLAIFRTASKNFAPGAPRTFRDCRQYWPWRWPAALISYAWFAVDDSLAEVDFNVHVVVESAGFDDKNQGRTVVLCTQDFPLGKRRIGDIADQKAIETRDENGSKLAALDSGYFPFAKPIPNTHKPCLPVNITVTVTEGNDLGDIIGKGAAELKKNSDRVAKQLVDLLGDE